MERLHDKNDLAKFLAKQSKRKITIVSAFASGTTELLKTIAARNDIEVIVGTINAFTSPEFIKDAAALLPRKLWVDFRGEDSIHWKLYLISPDTVIIGSSNFTDRGVKLDRDTCVVIRDQDLYDDYAAQIRALKRKDGVLGPQSDDYEARLAKHIEQHNRNQAAAQAARAVAGTKPLFEEWIKEGFSSLPLYVWETNVPARDQKTARKLVKNYYASTGKAGATPGARRGKQPYRDLLATNSEGHKPPFAPGTIVLTVSQRGGSMRFLQLDIVIRDRERKRDYMIALFKPRYDEPFRLTKEIKAAVKEIIRAKDHDGYSLSVDSVRQRIQGKNGKGSDLIRQKLR